MISLYMYRKYTASCELEMNPVRYEMMCMQSPIIQGWKIIAKGIIWSRTWWEHAVNVGLLYV